MLNVNDGTLDAFVLDYCAAHNIICDGDAFGLVFSGKDTFTEAEAVDLIEQGVRTYGLRFDHVITLPDMVAWEAFAAANAEALTETYGTIEKALRHALDGGLTLGGGAQPLTLIHFEA